ncbi:hypothetical protein DOY81_012958 [Sarcophaga bullata]|nr:hypothetical protein DOY81_012958 [Sarcophaga bullata]
MSYLEKICFILSLLALNHWTKAENTNAKNRDICKSQYDGAILPNSNDCHKFYICVNQQAHEYNCDPSYHFDKTTRSCKPGATCSNANNNKPQNNRE